MNYRAYNLLLLFSSWIGYLQWGDEHSAFLIQVEWDVFREMISNPLVFFNPVILIPLVGQLFIIIAAIKKKPNKYLTYTGITAISLLFGLIFYVGFLSKIYWISLSTVPFFAVSFLTIRHYRKL